jgi:CHAD domain-containing protein
LNTYLLDGRLGARLLRLARRSSYALRKESSAASERTYYDSFDGRLFDRGRVLVSRCGRLTLERWRDGGTIEEIAAPTSSGTGAAGTAGAASLAGGASGARLFWWDVAEGRLADRLRRTLDARAAVAQAVVRAVETVLRVVDGQGKPVARVAVIEAEVVRGGETLPMGRWLELRPSKGCRGSVGRMAALLAKEGLDPVDESEYARALGVLGRDPRGVPRQPPTLRPHWPAERALRELLLDQLGRMRRVESGIIDDTDTEFLHEFRIAVRKVRVLVAALAGVLPAELTEEARVDFAYVGRVTGRLRDFDVILLNARDYRAKVPDDLQPALQGFFARLRVTRREELAGLTDALRSEPYLGIVSRWEATLARPLRGGSRAGVPAARVVGKLIRKRLDRLRKLFASFGKHVDAEDLHRLRIECKKLRYLTDSFGSLFPGGALDPLVKQLGRLQKQLGRQHDLAVQQATLRTCLREIEPVEKDDLEMAAAIGALTAALSREQADLDRGFKRNLAGFDRRARASELARMLERRGA